MIGESMWRVNPFFFQSLSVVLLLHCLSFTVESAPSAVSVDPNLKPYVPAKGVSGSINSIGSDTMNNLMSMWSEGFKRHYPNIKVEIDSKGSSAAPPALIAGSANFGPMSRAMKEAEIDEFEGRFGYKPTALETSLDVIAVYVNKDNPIAGLSLKQLDAIFSVNRAGGYAQNLITWGDVGLNGEWAKRPISLYGRNSASGTYGFFKANALFGGDFKPSVKEQPGSSAVVQGTGSDIAGAGYSGIGYRTPDVRAIPLGVEDGEYYEAVSDNTYTGDYPLSRFLFLYVNYNPNEQLDPLRYEFIHYVFSRDGQLDVVKAGYFPISQVIAQRNLRAVNIKQ